MPDRPDAYGPWSADGLTPRVAALVALATVSPSTALDQRGTRRQIRAALAAGATREEVLTVLQMASPLSIHTCSVDVSLMREEAAATGLALPVIPDPPPAAPTDGAVEPKVVELISIAFNASIRHLYGPGIRRHIRAALALGATVPEVMGVLQVCVAQGAQACNVAMPILAEELTCAGKGDGA